MASEAWGGQGLSMHWVQTLLYISAWPMNRALGRQGWPLQCPLGTGPTHKALSQASPTKAELAGLLTLNSLEWEPPECLTVVRIEVLS
jgi:hypothetical protein